MEVSVLQAALIGISCWLGSVENSQPLGVAFSDAMSKPIVGGTVVGLILGDVVTGVTIGAAVQAMYLGQVLIGGKRQVICWIENHIKKIDNYIEN